MPPEIQTAFPAETPWIRKRWVQNLLWGLGTALLLYALVAADVLWRARESYLQGEKYMRWNSNPESKKSELNAAFEKDKSNLDRELAKGKITKDEYDRQLEILTFDRDRQMEESALKYAYVWYQTAYELFAPPESKWVKMSREKAAKAKEQWKEELRAKKVPFEDYMLE